MADNYRLANENVGKLEHSFSQYNNDAQIVPTQIQTPAFSLILFAFAHS